MPQSRVPYCSSWKARIIPRILYVSLKCQKSQWLSERSTYTCNYYYTNLHHLSSTVLTHLVVWLKLNVWDSTRSCLVSRSRIMVTTWYLSVPSVPSCSQARGGHVKLRVSACRTIVPAKKRDQWCRDRYWAHSWQLSFLCQLALQNTQTRSENSNGVGSNVENKSQRRKACTLL